ncbi:MAG: hypothetical protein ACI4MH_00990 [Candidatus Coproplasma sp.]
MRTNFTLIKLTRRKLICLLSALIAAACALYCGCAQNGPESEAKLKVSVADSVFFVAEDSTGEVERGENFTVALKMRAGYVPVSCDYSDYVIEGEDGDYRLTLNNITRPSRVTVTSERVVEDLNTNEEKTCLFIYDYNDGTGRTEEEECTFSYHIRPNTRIGAGIERDGYTLTGWNTESDGSGERVGLGSRITAEDGEEITLYADWIEQLPEEDFLYEVLPDGTVSLTGYRGDGLAGYFALPSKIGGRSVTRVSNSFTTNIPCGRITSKTLVLPSTIREVENYAFRNAEFDEMYFFDNLESVSDMAFTKNISHYHINAITPPRMLGSNYNARFADNLDIIIKNADKKKMIFFSGCSLAYGLCSPIVAAEFEDYAVVNAGLNGEFNGLFQLECMLPYICEGDVLVHAPEPMNQYQFMESMRIDGRVFAMVEGNYDLLANADFSYTDRFFAAWEMYLNLRSGQEECSYSDYSGDFNVYGDYAVERPYDESNESSRDVAYTENCRFESALLTGENIAALAEIYGKFEARGASVFYSWAPISEQSDGNEDIYLAAEQFQDRLAELFKPYGYKIISEVTDYIYKGRYFYDTDYHLNDLGVILRTERLIADLKAALGLTTGGMNG